MAMRPSIIWTALLLPVLFLADSFLALQPPATCQQKCGSVDMHFPFGIGDGCFLPGFEIECTTGGTPILAGNNNTLAVLNLTVMPRPEAEVMLPIAYNCYNTTDGASLDWFYGSVGISPAYRISNTSNELIVLGCNTFAYTNSGPGKTNLYSFYTGCVAYCDREGRAEDGACAGIGCCRVDIPPGLTDNTMTFFASYAASTFFGYTHTDLTYSPCDYAFIVKKNTYDFRVSDLKMDTKTTKPLVLDWAIRNIEDGNKTCAEVKNKPGYACVSDNSECLDSYNSEGYICNCTSGFWGNPYLTGEGGCQDINECDDKWKPYYPCKGVCHNKVGSYGCDCPSGQKAHDGNAYENVCASKFPVEARIALGISLGVFVLIVALLLAFIMLQKRKLDKLFEKNGGEMLKNVNGLSIFTKDVLKKITKDNAEFLGNGSFGNVYKGTLPDNTMVAVKASIKVDEATKEEFVDEVEIQTQMIHKNILKLVGCCLEVEVPVLVYEFAANGSLQDILHRKKDQVLPLDSRLDIAIGSAEGLKYMHSYATHAMRHGDVKPDNILLDDKLTPKIADFGLSKLLKEEYYAKVVVGCMGYIDPVFMKTGLLTQKSDVYSFGAVLLELITGKKNVYDEKLSLIIEYRKVYEKERSGRAMFDNDITTEEDISILEEMGKLAMDCLKEDLEDRPDMTEVAEQLVMIRRNKKFGKSNNTNPNNIGDITIYNSPTNTNTEVVSGTTRANISAKVTPSNMDILPSP
ncbi:wall-associated receptor kinase 1 [Lolium perenne]|uniref:wall-associated receptor kinase 1 n=1 Tax=Lolium perenne TaxID=4522 RepID=UPI0021F648AF|nr:wall-associated receptor kinase 1-like [Lolium perenne]